MYNFTIFPHLRVLLLSVIKGCYNVIKCYKCSLFSFNFQPAFYSSLTFANNFWWPCHIIIIIITTTTTTTIKFSLTWSIVNGHETDICGCCCHYPKNVKKAGKTVQTQNLVPSNLQLQHICPLYCLCKFGRESRRKCVHCELHRQFFQHLHFQTKKNMQMSLAGPGLPFELFPFLLSDSICCIIARLLPSVLHSSLIITFLSEPFSQKGRKRAHLSVTKLLLLLPSLPSFAGIDLPLLSVAKRGRRKKSWKRLMMNDHWRIKIWMW